MAHVAKYTRGATGQLSQHYERKQNEKGEYIKFGNQDIDLTKTHENYNLAPHRQEGQVNFIRERCHMLHCLKRLDVNVMASWVVTMPKSFPKEKEREFFEQSYKFLTNRYGGEKNVISAYVHKDENQPHMHFAFVPVVYDQKKGKEKVSAKECINKKDLLTFHKDLSKHMEKHFGKDVGILNEQTRDGNKSIEELKRQSAAERLNEVMEKSKEIMTQTHNKASEMLQKASEHIEEAKEVLKPIEEKKEALKGQINALEHNLKVKEGFNVSIYEIDQIQGKKTLLGNNITVPRKDFEKIRETAKEGIRLRNQNAELKSNYEWYKKAYTEIKGKFDQSTQKVKELTKDLNISQNIINAVKQLCKEDKDFGDKLEKNVDRILNKQREETLQKEKTIRESKSRGFER